MEYRQKLAKFLYDTKHEKNDRNMEKLSSYTSWFLWLGQAENYLVCGLIFKWAGFIDATLSKTPRLLKPNQTKHNGADRNHWDC